MLLKICTKCYITGKSPDKSMSQDSSDGSPHVETHRRSKSILKNKSESSVSKLNILFSKYRS